MVTVRCTQKLLRRFGVARNAEVGASTAVLGDWYANLFFSRPQQLIVCMNAPTLSVVLVPARDHKGFSVRFLDAVTNHLRMIGVAPAAVEAESAAMSEVSLGPTASRSVLGCLREAEYALAHELEHPRFASLAEIELYFSEYIYSTTGYRRPRDLVHELFEANVSRSADVAGLQRDAL